ncbi:putative quinol monooxygenase [uncultured Sphingomonas sp.]|uniref:putative quinol monooxygenase n=1 Tax=uncultured Sphingomonas sp. TaxID=158754 RepID=UPI0035C9A2A8
MIVIAGSATAKPGAFDRPRAEGLAPSERSRRENGCLRHRLYVDAADRMRLFFYEGWRDRTAAEAHFRHPDTSAMLVLIREHAAASEGPTLFEATPLRR